MGTTSWIAARVRASSPSNAAVSEKSIDASSARARSSSRRMGALSGDSSTTSNVQKGSAADAGRLIHSGRRPRSSCRLRDLLPTISPVNSGDATACLPRKRRRVTETPPAGALIAPPSDDPGWDPPAAGAAPRLAAPPATGSTRKSSAEGEGTHLTAWPASCSISVSFPPSNTVAKRQPSLRARTETCDRMSGMSGVMTPTTPCGMSSSPPTLRETRMVGTEYVLVWMSLRSSTTSTTPEASTGEMTFHAPMCAISRSTGSSARSICDSGAAAVPRTISSEKMSSTWRSTPSAPPMALAVACIAPMYRPEHSPSAFCTRSVIAFACRAQSVPPRVAASTMPRHSRRQMTSSSFPPEDSARFSSAKPVILSTSAGARRDMDPSAPSTTWRTALSSARSR